MATFREMQDRINLDYLNRTDLASETKRAIIRAVKYYEKDRLWFNITATALAIGTASTTVAIPADFLALDYATVSWNGNNEIMTIRSFDRIAYQNKGSVSAMPSEICYWRDSLNFSPKPSSATTITVHYTHSMPVLSADTDTNPWTSAGEDVIVYRATYDMMANVLRVADKDALASYKSMEMEAYKMLQYGNSLRQNTGAEGAVVGSNQNQSPKTPHTPNT